MAVNVHNKEKLKEFGEWLVSPFGIIVIAAVAIGLILLVVSINLVYKTIRDSDAEWSYEEYDPASDTTFEMVAPTNDESDEALYVGFELLLQNGVTRDQFALFKDAVSGYAESKNMELTRVSYLKDSYKLEASYVFDFKIVLNIDQETLKVRIDSSVGWKDIMGAKVELWNEIREKLYEIEITEDNICEYFRGYECGDDGD
ncbi:hypothetical protein IKF30_00405 [Candidatus Saccharibacteria bacterium]|nr:hypothetical protein [Candidatus Saccharibacteria bacterium]